MQTVQIQTLELDTQLQSPARPSGSFNPRSYEIDANLPVWARRSHPIVRWQLGLYWKVIFPEVTTLLQLMGVQLAVLLVSAWIPFVLSLYMPMIIVSVVLLPPALYYYGRALFLIGRDTSSSLVNERKKGRLELLRATPIPLDHIILSKGAAGIWRQSEDLSLLFGAVVMLSMPVVVMQHAALFSPESLPIVARLTMALGFVVSVYRMLVEPAMVAMLGVVVGAVAPDRTTALITTTALVGFYFVCMALPVFAVTLPAAQWILATTALPLLLPPLVIWVCYRATHRALRGD